MSNPFVRYAGSGGCRIRQTPAGSIITTINAGNLMYEVPGYDRQTASLSGTTYVWAYVHYYTPSTGERNPGTEGEGWVSLSNAIIISSATQPSKTAITCNDTAITQEKQLTNARYIYNFLKAEGWSDNAIFGMLGNMEAESYINPGKWENSNQTGGYGLTHWTPSSKLTDWANANNLSSSDIDTQLERILYEVSTSTQWVKGGCK